MSVKEPWPYAKEDRPRVLEVLDGFVRVWRTDCRELTADDETAEDIVTACKGHSAKDPNQSGKRQSQMMTRQEHDRWGMDR